MNKAPTVVAVNLLGMGIVTGDRVALLVGTTVESICAIYGSIASDVTFVPLDPRMPRDKVILKSRVFTALSRREEEIVNESLLGIIRRVLRDRVNENTDFGRVGFDSLKLVKLQFEIERATGHYILLTAFL